MTDPGISVIIPVKDGARYLGEVLEAVQGQRLDTAFEVLVVDSGSNDDSVEIARRAGAELIEIAADEFGHGRTRNLAAERARGDVLVFITQDATPSGPGWLAALTAPIDLERRVGLSFGPHLPRPGTSPMVARELEQFFAGFSPGGDIRTDCHVDAADPATGYFSNVNSCIARPVWDRIRFRDVAYAEDQAFAQDAIAQGWCKAFAPSAAVLHAHDFSFTGFMRRYFDEYRGLRDSVGHVEPIGLRRLAGNTRSGVAGDVTWMKREGWPRGRRIVWGARAGRHHAGRALFSALGSRSDRLPAAVSQRLSLEGRPDRRVATAAVQLVRSTRDTPNDYTRSLSREAAAPLAAPSPHDGEKPLLQIAWIVPPFRRGSGGHMTLFTIAREFEERGHSCSIWIYDPTGMMDRRAALAQREIEEHFVPLRAGVYRGFDDWQGADVAFATGWQTAYPLRTLPGCMLKAYFVQDYEPDFYPASAERVWAEATYGMGFPCVAASPWLRDLVRERYGVPAEGFELGVDFDVYRPAPIARDPETVVFYARPATPRRATELGVLALAELAERRSDLRIVMFGDVTGPTAPFDYEFGGVMAPEALAALYNRATVGLVISLTNYSRMPKEMMACGLPVVDISHPSVMSVFGEDGRIVAQADPDPASLADRISTLLDDRSGREEQSRRAREFVAGMTWTAAAEQVDRAVRGWLSERWRLALPDTPRDVGEAGDGAALLRAHLT